MLRAFILQAKVDWENILLLIEFTYNNSFYTTIQMAPYEALHGQKCKSPLYSDEIGNAKLLT